MKKLLVALDTSPIASTVLAEAMEQAKAHNAKLVLLLANHVGDAHVLEQAIAAAREDVAPSP